MTGRDAHQIYNSIRLHFTTDFNAVKYNFKTRVSEASFHGSNLKYLFEKLSRTYPSIKEIINYFSSNFLEENTWPSDMKQSCYNSWQARMESLGYEFNTDCKKIVDEVEGKLTLNELINGEDTTLYDMLIANEIKIETLCLFEMLFNKRWFQINSDPLGLYKTLRDKVYKYRLILEYNSIRPTSMMAKKTFKTLTPILNCGNIQNIQRNTNKIQI